METDRKNLLVIDDDAGLRSLLQRYLEEQGYSVLTAADGREMDAVLATQIPDLIVLDLMLPGEDGLSIARRLRASTEVPIIMLSAKGEDIDRIIGLEVGADDYVPKPFNPRELLARIRAVLRRRAMPGESTNAEFGVSIYSFGPYKVNLDSRVVTANGKEVPLTTAEYSLLQTFIEHPNRVLSRDALVDLLKGYDRSPFDRSVDIRVTRLRRKLEENPKSPRFIRTIWGAGYMFTPKGEPQAT